MTYVLNAGVIDDDVDGAAQLLLALLDQVLHVLSLQ
jgi:hypothetical protein